MRISLNWLKDYINLTTEPETLAGILTGCGLEVESLNQYCSVKGGLDGVVIGEVKTCIPHPNSDHLSITTVDISRSEPLHIVCGASNVMAGQKVAVATIGTTLYFKDQEIKLQKTKIRGEVSEGMICAEDELGLGTSHEGIMVLDPFAIPGTLAKEYFDVYEDVILEIGLTPNRSDAASHIGVARDLVAVCGINQAIATRMDNIRLMIPDVGNLKTDNNKRRIDVVIEDTTGCPRYTGLTMIGIKVADSPKWLRDRLNAIGLRPINNIVDITNYILYETGQPLHAFDADKIRGEKVIIKKLRGGTKFTTLDEVERELTDNDLMICNAEEPMVIAGVFGGLESGVTENTRNIFLESACFDPRTIRLTSKYHGLQTDASFRFERGSDIDITVYAIKRAALMIREMAGGEISSEIVDVYPHPFIRKTVNLSYDHLDRLIGKKIERDTVKKILISLGFEVLGDDQKGLDLRVPAFKTDVTREADIIEEVLRIYGYNNVEIPASIHSSVSYAKNPDPEKIQNLISDYLVANGFYEIINNSLTRSAYYEGNTDFREQNSVRILNPLSRDLAVLRQTLLYNGFETIVYNQNRKIQDIKLFEFGTIYSKVDPEKDDHSGNSSGPLLKYQEEKHLALYLSGRAIAENWNSAGRKVDFYDLKGYINNVLVKANIDLSKLKTETLTGNIIKEGMVVLLDGKILVNFGELSRLLLNKHDIRQEIFYADFFWDNLLSSLDTKGIKFRELPKFPEVRRDIAMLVDNSVTFAQIEKLAYETEKRVLKKVGLFDVYEGEKIEHGKKSYAVSFILLDEQKTLTDNEIEKVMQKLVRMFEEKLNAHLR
ncbi:MAG: phenylalanine--tRNA ligase subunit beta [Bacteroidetes bacterium]|nr:phenylalanine--tRNA ligase subunit beta [Bacteroidota bacterium]